VAVSLGEEVVAEERIGTMHGQAEELLPLVDRAMREAGQMPGALDLVVATVGPGSFTGIRVGLAAARGIALATGARLIGVTSFDAVAVLAVRNDWPETRSLLVALESRREDFYVQFFDSHGYALGEPAAIMPFSLRGAVAEAIGASSARTPSLSKIRHPAQSGLYTPGFVCCGSARRPILRGRSIFVPPMLPYPRHG
jgi:tRNA threonylcarbamoyl adenosine modification protein YeaZ